MTNRQYQQLTGYTTGLDLRNQVALSTFRKYRGAINKEANYVNKQWDFSGTGNPGMGGGGYGGYGGYGGEDNGWSWGDIAMTGLGVATAAPMAVGAAKWLANTRAGQWLGTQGTALAQRAMSSGVGNTVRSWLGGMGGQAARQAATNAATRAIPGSGFLAGAGRAAMSPYVAGPVIVGGIATGVGYLGGEAAGTAPTIRQNSSTDLDNAFTKQLNRQGMLEVPSWPQIMYRNVWGDQGRGGFTPQAQPGPRNPYTRANNAYRRGNIPMNTVANQVSRAAVQTPQRQSTAVTPKTSPQLVTPPQTNVGSTRPAATSSQPATTQTPVNVTPRQ